MCGIVGFIGNNVLPNTINSLNSLEYRGYDSCGVGFFNKGEIKTIKCVGCVEKLKKKINFIKYKNVNIAIGHTRWATHGKVSIKNSHPFESNNLIIIHNGIIENYSELKAFLESNNYNFKTEVDSEAIAHLIDYYYKNNNYIEAINKAKIKLKGSFSFIVLFKDNDKTIFGVKKDSPLFIGKGDSEVILSSDLSCISSYTEKYIPIYDNEVIACSKNDIKIYNEQLEKVDRVTKIISIKKEEIIKKKYPHFMLKEIDQEEEIFNNIKSVSLDYLESLIKNKKQIVIIGCGSAYYAGLIGKALFEQLLNIKVDVLIASEFRYSPFIYDANSLFIFISQSGETADTIAALRLVKAKKIATLGIINVAGSTIANECDYLINLNVGKEIAVASTKAYFAQVAYLYKLCFLYAKINDININELENEFYNFSLKIDINSKEIKELAKKISKFKNVFFIGRTIDYYLSLEGSLKLKEITYIHSEAYPSGELKHGPISLINKKSLVIAIITNNQLKSKTYSNIEEILSRGSQIILISDDPISLKKSFNLTIDEKNSDFIKPLSVIPLLQLLSYYCAIYKKTNIDKPRNLAKSVTVE